MAYTLAQNPAGATNGATNTISKAFGSTVTARSLLVAFVTTDAATPGTFVFSGGGTWAALPSIKEPLSTQWIAIGYCLDAAGGSAPTVQATWTGNGNFNGLMIGEFTNSGVPSLLDANTTGTLGNSYTPTDSAMTATDLDAIVSYAIRTSGTTTAGAASTIGAQGGNVDAWEYRILTSPGSVTPAFIQTVSEPWAIISAAFNTAPADPPVQLSLVGHARRVRGG